MMEEDDFYFVGYVIMLGWSYFFDYDGWEVVCFFGDLFFVWFK